MDMFFAALSAIAALLFPLLSGYITGQVLSEWTGQTEKRLILAGIGLLVLLIIRVTSNVIYAYFGHAMGAKMEADMREELFVHYRSAAFFFSCEKQRRKTDDGYL